MKYIAIIGFGIVGGGITEVLCENREKIQAVCGEPVEVKYILDLRDFPDSPYADRVVHDIDTILADPEVALVCETMGGSHPAYEFSVRCMEAGKSVVTSNKEVVAGFGDALLETAKRCGVDYLFEASVGGGIPVIRPFMTSLAGETITSVSGIVNGTTNYILTQMKENGISFSQALAEAQALGYAEKNPAADIDGFDARRKIVILAALASGILVDEKEVYVQSLSDISTADLNGAEKIGAAVRYIAEAKLGEKGMAIYVMPMMVKKEHPLAGISGVYNGISVSFSLTGDIMYYGRGAGRYPTAGAVVTDVCASLSGAAGHEKMPVFKKAEGSLPTVEDMPFPYYIRVEAAPNEISERFGKENISVMIVSEENGVVEAETGPADWKTLQSVLKGIGVQRVMRIREA